MKQMFGILFAGATALSAQGFTTNVSTVAELAGALQYMNTAANAKPANEIVLGKGEYDVSGLRLDWYFAGYKVMTNMVDNFGISYFTLRGATGNPRDVVIYGSDATSNLRLMYNYVGVVRDLTFSNCTTTAGDVLHGHNASAIFSNVVVTCCSSASYGPANSGEWYDCQFVGNTCSGENTYGGAMYNAKAYGCLFEGNSAKYGGAVFRSVLSNCTVRANTASAYGGGIGGCYATNCIITGNSAQSGGGAVGGVSSRICVLSDCVVAGNFAQSGGGAFGNGSPAQLKIDGGTISNNVSALNGGALYSCTATDCDIVANVATNSGGGVYYCTLSNCTVRDNFAKQYGGGVCGEASKRSTLVSCVVSNNASCNGGGGAYYATITDSRICMNFVDGSTAGDYSTGGGVYWCIATDSTIDGNAVIKGAAKKNSLGGGAYDSALTNCVICNNYVDNLAGGAGNGYAYGCIISNNACLASSNGLRTMKWVENCDIYEGTIDTQGPMFNCRIMNYTNGNVIANGANVYTNGWIKGAPGLIRAWCCMTNCLIVGNKVTTLIAHSANKHTILSGCTIADNSYDNMTSGFTGPTNTLNMINCILARNTKDGTQTWNFNPTYGYIALTNCVIGTFNNTVQLVYPMSNIITNNNPRFVDDGSRDSYALKTSSPAVGKGLVQDWMADALDVRNDARYPRLRDGLVDIGCYECWLDPVGTYIMFR